MKHLALILLTAIISSCCLLGRNQKITQQCNFTESVCKNSILAFQNGVEKFHAQGGMYIIKDMGSREILENTSLNFDTNAVYATYFSKINFENKTTPERLLNKYINLVQISGKKLHQKLRENVIGGTGSTGRKANIAHVEVSGITATTEKGSEKIVTTTFLGHFKHNGKNYAYVFILDEPKGLKQTYGWQSAGWNVVPTARNVIENIIN